ncbi:MAG: DEAD/DEAH box helicase family protein, partial [Bacteroidales bacterium]|nr:DEAD/DEAH box helicase family protein [Bacteroidales bacterium]
MPNTNDQMTAPQAYTINDVLREIRLKTLTEREKGADFERLMQRWFLTDPRYENLVKVWMWNEFPAKKELGGIDLGIDLVAKTDLGDYWAIQCKCYDEDATIDKPALDSFLSNASRGFTDEETFQRKTFSNLIWVSTTKTWGQNAEKAVQNLNVPFTRINIHDLENSPVDWHKLVHGTKGKEAKLPGKQPMKHQLVAIGKAYEHYITNGNERGKLIMACGTGKTYTALRIMETMTEKDATVLFFVPSIALLSQTHVAWMADKTDQMRAICICSDNKVGTIGANGGLFTNSTDPEEDILADSIIDQACPASTNVSTILRQINKAKKDRVRTVIMSTYQSIDVVIDAMRQAKITADLCICDEAHRTTGVKIKDEDPSPFTKVHDNGLIPAHKRLYMTATPRLYRESVKIKAKENDDVLCSMDDEAIYGKEFHRLGFNDAVNQNLLTDYKVLVLTVSESDIPENIQNKIKDTQTSLNGAEKLKELNFDDATKLIGCINGLSKRLWGDEGVTREQDPTFIHRAVAFCQTINATQRNPAAASKTIATHFPELCREYRRSLTEEVKKEVVTIEAAHIDGTMNANERNKLINWLKEDTGNDNECRVLCNVRCLSEGVDVPALDAVLFLSPRKSEVEVVQSVGRVMRSFGKGTAHEKKYGYIIIPVVVPEDVRPENALNDNERFKVVWTILNALRSHDENFNAHVNQINLNRKKSAKVTVAAVAARNAVCGYSIGEGEPQKLEGGAVTYNNEEIAEQLRLRFGDLHDGIYGRIVEKVGDKMYWENWAGKVGLIAQNYIEKISKLVHDETGNQKAEFDEFVKTLQKNLNPGITPDQCVEMLAQHLITRPVFEALFSDYKFVSNNSISSSMQFMIDYLRSEAVDSDLDSLQSFYDSVRVNVGNIDNLEGKQTIIKNLYEKFFKRAFPKTVETLGTVYTPVECVDFIIHSVDAVLKKEFGTALTNDNVHILDPFTGTGTFITRLLQSGVIENKDLLRKYSNEIHCNEIVLLAYYVADVNIEAVFHELYSQEEYVPFDGICLTDTFQLGETDSKEDMFGNFFKENSIAVERQKMAPIRVIIGNPPYSVGQKSANDNAQNQHYPKLEQRIADTYVEKSSSKLSRSTYDSYIKAFRWATDRINDKEGGVVAFISNGAWLDGNSQDGFRATLTKDFDKIYVFNLRGNCRLQGESRRKEGDNVFAVGSRTPIAITILVKYPEERHSYDCEIYYHDIGDYLSREQKLEIIKKFKSVEGINWDRIVPNEKNDWLNQRDGLFDNLLPLTPETKFTLKSQSVFSANSPAVKTNRDAWTIG